MFEPYANGSGSRCPMNIGDSPNSQQATEVKASNLRSRPPLLQQRAPVAAIWLFFWRQHYGRGYAVAGFQVQEADALRVAAGLADGFRIHPDDFAVLADEHDLGSFVHQRDGDYFADAIRGLDIDDAFAGAVGEAVFVGGCALAVSVLGYGEDERTFLGEVDCLAARDIGFDRWRCLDSRGGCPHMVRDCSHRALARLWRDRHSYYVVALFQVDAINAVGGAAHGADVIFVEADSHAFMRGDEDDLVAVGNAGGDEFVSLFDVDGVDAVGADMHELAQFGFFHQAVARGEENVFVLFFEVAHGEHGADGFAGLQSNEVADVLAFAGGADVGNLVNLKPVDAALVGEDENVSVRGGNEEVLDEILVAGLHPGAPGAAAPLHAIGGDGRA